MRRRLTVRLSAAVAIQRARVASRVSPASSAMSARTVSAAPGRLDSDRRRRRGDEQRSWSSKVLTTEIEGKVAGGRRISTARGRAFWTVASSGPTSPSVGRGRRSVDISYVVTKGTFLIGHLGNYLIADSVALDVEITPAEALVRPSNPERGGDYQCNAAMSLAKRLGRPSREIGDAIAASIDPAGVVEAPTDRRARVRHLRAAHRLAGHPTDRPDR